ncbi:hypothetical protein MASR2M12_02830 [Bacteroidales bacterium]
MIGIVATILAHSLLLLALFFLALRTPLPLPAEEGVEVDLGFSAEGMGQIQPDLSGGMPDLAQAAELPQPEKAEESVVTQSTEEAPALPKQEKPKPKKEKNQETKPRVEKHPPQQTAQPAAQTVPEQPKVNRKALFKGSGEQEQSSGNEGVTGQPGDQGRPEGIKDVKHYEGSGGQGNGPSYSLGGRGALRLAEPKASFSEQGNVVVDIWVNPKGVVERAEVSLRGTTIVDANLKKIAVNAALNSRFSEDSNAPSLQKGTITYTFIIGN